MYKQIHDRFWGDAWILSLPADLKLLYVYLFAGPRTNLAGVYDLTISEIALHTGLEPDTIEQGLDLFAQAGKVVQVSGWIWVRNLVIYNANNLGSPKIRAHLLATLANVPPKLAAQWVAHFNREIAATRGLKPLEWAGAATAPEEEDKPQLPRNLEDWLALLKEAQNKPAALRHMIETLCPWAELPAYSYIGKAGRQVGGAGRLAELIWIASAHRPSGDLLAYCLAMAKKRPIEQGPTPEEKRASLEEWAGEVEIVEIDPLARDWKAALAAMAGTMGQATVDRWLRGSEPVSMEGGVLTINVTVEGAREILSNRLSGPVGRAASQVFGELQTITFTEREDNDNGKEGT